MKSDPSEVYFLLHLEPAYEKLAAVFLAQWETIRRKYFQLKSRHCGQNTKYNPNNSSFSQQ